MVNSYSFSCANGLWPLSSLSLAWITAFCIIASVGRPPCRRKSISFWSKVGISVGISTSLPPMFTPTDISEEIPPPGLCSVPKNPGPFKVPSALRFPPFLCDTPPIAFEPCNARSNLPNPPLLRIH